MKGILLLGIISLWMPILAFAIPPVVMSGPIPVLAPTYFVGTETTLTYKITNNVPSVFPLSVSGISNGISRTTVPHDCRDSLAKGPSTCNIGILIKPLSSQNGTHIHQTLRVDYNGRTPLESVLAFNVDMFSYAYVVPNVGTHFVDKCTLNSATGTFESCADAYVGSTQSFVKLAFAKVNGVPYAYVANFNGFIDQCTLGSNGSFNTCIETPQSPPGWNPYAIAFAKSNGVQYSYVTDTNSGNIYQCTLNLEGSFNSCTSTGVSFSAPYGIAFATVNNVQYAYIADAGPGGLGSQGNVYQCTMNSVTGDISACSVINITTGCTPEWIPYTISFAEIGGIQYAYVGDNGTSFPGNMYLCTLNSDGSFNTCRITPSLNAPSWAPSDVAFDTLNGVLYGYVTSYQGPHGGLYRCEVNMDGSFNSANCLSQDFFTSARPIGIAFNFFNV